MNEAESLVAEWESRFDECWESFWAGLSPAWRRVLSGSESDTPSAAAPILRRRRLTTDFAWIGHLQPVTCLPTLCEALLWDSNGMDLGPLTRTLEGCVRPWDRLLLGGPVNVDLGQLRGMPVRQLILSVVDVHELDALGDLPGLESLTLDLHGESVTLPPLSGLRELTLYSDTSVDDSTFRANPGLRVNRIEESFWPPFGPDDVN